METIRNYLETMFLNLPNTPQVQRAKNELWQMMEDKYTELKQSGKSENEAIGIVISEFGNLDELAEDLGIGNVMHQQQAPEGRHLSLDDAKRYLKEQSRHAYLIALGVLLCIVSPCGPILFSAMAADYGAFHSLNVIGVVSLFVLVAIAVGLFIYSSMMVGHWDHLKRELWYTDFATTSYISEQRESYKPAYALMLTIGVILCILCVVPSIIMEALSEFSGNIFLEDISAALVLIIVAIGVFMLVFSSMKMGSFTFLLNLNTHGTIGASYTPSQEEKVYYEDKTVAAVMSVFWPTTTCLYLIWSFLSFDWHITWIIWPIAGIIHSLLKNLLGKQ